MQRQPGRKSGCGSIRDRFWIAVAAILVDSKPAIRGHLTTPASTQSTNRRANNDRAHAEGRLSSIVCIEH